MILMIEEPTFVGELLETIHVWNKLRMKVVLSAPIDLYIRRAWYERCDFLTPRFYHDALLPRLKAEAELAHEHGARFGYICFIGTKPTLDLYVEAGIDVLISVDPIQGTHTDLPLMKEKLGPHTCLWGGVSGAVTVEMGTNEEVRVAVRQAIETLAPTGHILSLMDNITVDAPLTWRNIIHTSMDGLPYLDDATRLARLRAPTGRVRAVLDTDTYNEIDDQFALAYALLSPEKLDLEAVYAAPFLNSRSTGPGDGMEKSYEEILRILDRMRVSPEGFVYRGSTSFLPGAEKPVESDAARNLIERAMAAPAEEPLYVLTIGASTNVASAILLEPRIVERILIVWLGGTPLWWPDVEEFNLRQDLYAARVLLDSGVPLVLLPTYGVTSHLLTTLAEVEHHLAGRNELCDYLVTIVHDYVPDHFAYGKVIWDISAVAWVLDESWVPTEVVHSPVLTDQVTWSVDKRRHLIKMATYVHRNPVFGDLFRKLVAFHAQG
jgi:inosine-uridine nucleoside N-ribohydrolase